MDLPTPPLPLTTPITLPILLLGCGCLERSAVSCLLPQPELQLSHDDSHLSLIIYPPFIINIHDYVNIKNINFEVIPTNFVVIPIYFVNKIKLLFKNVSPDTENIHFLCYYCIIKIRGDVYGKTN
jgi:hypothetical protein